MQNWENEWEESLQDKEQDLTQEAKSPFIIKNSERGEIFGCWRGHGAFDMQKALEQLWMGENWGGVKGALEKLYQAFISLQEI